uniref:FBA_2 domain-containing protein n=1 Tax=Steinernema glaseri TaxID=37863 RepID=A0A1I7YCY2_9BILA
MDRLSFWFYDQLSDILCFRDLRTLANNFESPRCWEHLLEVQEKKRKLFKLEIRPQVRNFNPVFQYSIKWMNGRGNLSLEDLDRRFDKRFTHIRSVTIDEENISPGGKMESPDGLTEMLTAICPRADSNCHFQFIDSRTWITRYQMSPLTRTIFHGPILNMRFSSIALDYRGFDCLHFHQADYGRLRVIDLRGTWPSAANRPLLKALESRDVLLLNVGNVEDIETSLLRKCIACWERRTEKIDVTISGTLLEANLSISDFRQREHPLSKYRCISFEIKPYSGSYKSVLLHSHRRMATPVRRNNKRSEKQQVANPQRSNVTMLGSIRDNLANALSSCAIM